MLAQNFKTAKDLGIAKDEHAALIKVLGMLERQELRNVDQTTKCDDGFNMGTQGLGCGTPACIGGWVARLTGKREMNYVDYYMPPPSGSTNSTRALTALYWQYRGDPTVDQAAFALRSFLTTGDPCWDLAVAS